MYFEGRGWKNGEMRREEGEIGGKRGKMGRGGGSWGREVSRGDGELGGLLLNGWAKELVG